MGLATSAIYNRRTSICNAETLLSGVILSNNEATAHCENSSPSFLLCAASRGPSTLWMGKLTLPHAPCDAFITMSTCRLHNPAFSVRMSFSLHTDHPGKLLLKPWDAS